MNNKIAFILFVLIVGLVSFLRFYKLSSVPPGVNRDEASIGYTAYSILHTGRDEYGRLFPFSFQSFGDWKLPLYIYAVVPFVSVLGMSELAVRFPSALFGILSVFLTYLLIKELFGNRVMAFITMILAAISPWSIHLSRVESESNTAVFLTLLGMILFLKSLKFKKWLIVPGLFCFALTYFAYAGNHVFTTLSLVVVFYLYRSKIPRTKVTFVGIILLIVMAGFIFSKTLFEANTTKISGISIFGDPSVVHAKIEIPRNEHSDSQSLFTKIVHNRVAYGMEKVAQNYLNAFSPEFLFIKGGSNNSHNILNFGNMYLIEAPFLFAGLIYLFAKKKGREKHLVLLWLFISPLAASITKDAPHTNRMFAVFPMLSLVSAFGIYWLFTEVIKKNLLKNILLGLFIVLFILNFLIYMDRYFVHFPRNEAFNWGIGYKALGELLKEPSFSSRKIIMTRPQYSPNIYLIFYNPYDPASYQKEAVRYPPTRDGFVDVRQFGRYEFRDIDWEKDLKKDAVLVAWSSEVPEDIKHSYEKHEVTLPNGESMFTVIKTK